jgi:hypothetical protein
MTDFEETLVDFYNGAHVLKLVATWAYVVANGQRVIEQVTSFERAYGKLVELHALGKLGVEGADFSTENLELVKRIRSLIQPGLGSDEALHAVEEIHTSAERCLRALTPSDPSSDGQPT